MQTDIPEDKAPFPKEDPGDTRVENRVSNVVAAIAVVALATIIIVQSQLIGEPGRPTDPGPGGYPTLLAVILIMVAIPLVFQRESGEAWPLPKHGLGPLAILAGMIAYTLILDMIGYIIPTMALILFGIKVADPKSSWIKSTVYALLFSVLIFYTFYTFLGVSLPRGDLERFLS